MTHDRISRLGSFMILGVLSMTSAELGAQCLEEVDLGPDTTLCTGATLLLDAGPGFESYVWSTGSTGQTLLVASAGTYTCTTTGFGTSGELVTNGDLSMGSTGFDSDYILGTGGPWGLVSDPGTFGTSTVAQQLHSNFSPCTDHTGGGNMLVVNGAQVAGQSVWCQTVPVQANTNYAFSAWLASVVSGSPAQLQFTVNGTPIGAGLNATSQTCNWLNFYSIWPSGPATSATICITNLNTSQGGNDFALDDISFAPFCTYTDEITVTFQADPAPDMGPDLVACEGDAILLDPAVPAADSFLWQDGSTAPTFEPGGSGLYWVEVGISGCLGRDSINVELSPSPVFELGPLQERCAGDRALLDATVPGATYLWQDGSTAPTYEVTAGGNYSVTVEVGPCSGTDNVSFIYHPLPIVDLGADTIICADTSLLFDVYRPGGTYVWQDGSSAATNRSAGANWYWVRVTGSGCSTTDSMLLDVIELPVVDLGPDRLLCVGTTERLDAFGAGLEYLWNDGSTDASLYVERPGLYAVTVSNSCGMTADTVSFTQDFCDCPVFVPNAFTPGDDGINDGFRPRFDCPTSAYTFRIFDRWGGLLWETNDPWRSWEGDNATALGVYAWTLDIRPEVVGATGTRRLTGHVLLLR